jgi:hypothetical protein
MGKAYLPQVWRQPDGTPVACVDKLKVLAENLAELREIAEDAFADALLMGCDEVQMRGVLRALVDGLENPFPQRAAS